MKIMIRKVKHPRMVDSHRHIRMGHMCCCEDMVEIMNGNPYEGPYLSTINGEPQVMGVPFKFCPSCGEPVEVEMEDVTGEVQ